jgi:MOSC domain-containing protein YiiM
MREFYTGRRKETSMALLTKLQIEGRVRHYPDAQRMLVKAAMYKRGVTARVKLEGTIKVDDTIALFLPPQRIYASS